MLVMFAVSLNRLNTMCHVNYDNESILTIASPLEHCVTSCTKLSPCMPAVSAGKQILMADGYNLYLCYLYNKSKRRRDLWLIDQL